MLLAELEIWHSRPIAPTRRVALGRRLLPFEPAPGFGGLLLGGIVAGHVGELDPELSVELSRLLTDVEAGRRIPQPRLRHRLQVDHHGLARSRHRLLGHGDALDFELETQGSPASQILGAVYAVQHLEPPVRSRALSTIRRALRWRGPIGPALVGHLTGYGGARSYSAEAFADPRHWALGVLGLERMPGPSDLERNDVQRRFRELLRLAHPDHGGASEAAAARIADLSEARRILLS